MTETSSSTMTEAGTSSGLRSWERSWTIEEMRAASVGGWSLASDTGLLNYLKDFSNQVFSQTKQLSGAVDDLVFTTNATTVQLHNTFNHFMQLSHTQYMENRVYDEDVANLTQTEQPASESAPAKPMASLTHEELAALLIPKYTEAIKLGISAVLAAPALGELDDLGLISTQEDGASASSLESHAPGHRLSATTHYEWDGPLPHVIGTKEFQEDEFCGLFVPPAEEEIGVLSDISAHNLSDLEEYHSDKDPFESGDVPPAPPPPPPQGMIPSASKKTFRASDSEEQEEDSGDQQELSASASEAGESDDGEWDDNPKPKQPMSLQEEMAARLKGKALPSAVKSASAAAAQESAADQPGGDKPASGRALAFPQGSDSEEHEAPAQPAVVIKAPAKKSAGGLFDGLDSVDDDALDAMLAGAKSSSTSAAAPQKAAGPKSSFLDLDLDDDLPASLAAGPKATAATTPKATVSTVKKTNSLFDALDDFEDDTDLFSGAQPKSATATPANAPKAAAKVNTASNALDLFADPLGDDDDTDIFPQPAAPKSTLDRMKALGGKSMLPPMTKTESPAATPTKTAPSAKPANLGLFDDDEEASPAAAQEAPAPAATAPKSTLDRIKAMGGQTLLPNLKQEQPAAKATTNPAKTPVASTKPATDDLFGELDLDDLALPASKPATVNPAPTTKAVPAKAPAKSFDSLFDDPLDGDDGDLFGLPAASTTQKKPAVPAVDPKKAAVPKTASPAAVGSNDLFADDGFDDVAAFSLAPKAAANPTAATKTTTTTAAVKQAPSSLFDALDDDTDLFSVPKTTAQNPTSAPASTTPAAATTPAPAVKAPTTTSATKAVPNKNNNSQKTSDGLFDDSDEGDLFSLPKAKTPASPVPVAAKAAPKAPSAPQPAADNLWGSDDDELFGPSSAAKRPQAPEPKAVATPPPATKADPAPPANPSNKPPPSSKADDDFWGSAGDDLFDLPVSNKPSPAASSLANKPSPAAPSLANTAVAAADDFWDQSDDEQPSSAPQTLPVKPVANATNPSTATAANATNPSTATATNVTKAKGSGKIAELQNKLSLDVNALVPGATPRPSALSTSNPADNPSGALPADNAGTLVHLTKDRAPTAKKRPPSRRQRGKATTSRTPNPTTTLAPVTAVTPKSSSSPLPDLVPSSASASSTPPVKQPAVAATKPAFDPLFSSTEDSLDSIFDIPVKSTTAPVQAKATVPAPKKTSPVPVSTPAVTPAVTPASTVTAAPVADEDDLFAPIVVQRKSRIAVGDLLASLDVPDLAPTPVTSATPSLPTVKSTPTTSRPTLVFDDDTDLFADPLANKPKATRINKNIFDDLI